MLQKDLLEVMTQWNTHRIRKSHENSINGIPNILYNIPSVGYRVCGSEISEQDIENIDGIMNIMEVKEALQVDIDLTRYFYYVVTNEQFVYPPRNWHQAALVFDRLIELCTWSSIVDMLLYSY